VKRLEGKPFILFLHHSFRTAAKSGNNAFGSIHDAMG
jgi:hypothetical protein